MLLGALRVILPYFQENGFYVECGGYDGETASNTLLFEKTRKWTGLLIEPDPTQYNALKTKNRKAFSVNSCLSLEPYPASVRSLSSDYIIVLSALFTSTFNTTTKFVIMIF